MKITELSKVTASDIQGGIFCLKDMFPKYARKSEPDPLMIYKSNSDPDTMYIHQSMKQTDYQEFYKAMKKEWEYQLNNGNFSVIERTEVP